MLVLEGGGKGGQSENYCLYFRIQVKAKQTTQSYLFFENMGGPEKGRLVLDMVFEEIVHSPGPDKVPTPTRKEM